MQSLRTRVPWNILEAEPRAGSTKLAVAITYAFLMLAVLAVLLLVVAIPAQGQTYSMLYNFTGGSDGGSPQSSLVSDAAGNFYGTTMGGGSENAGTVFELSPNGSGGWNETVLYSFTGGTDGAYPFTAVMFDSVGNLYGTASRGGANVSGVVFELSPRGAGWTQTVLYSFCSQSGCSDGAFPFSALIMDPAGNLYGTTFGAVFELSPSGGDWTERAIYSVAGSQYPMTAGLTMDLAGNIFGASGSTVFELSPNGSGGWNAVVLHTFAGAPRDGSDARGTPVLDQSGNLYGTTCLGGKENYGTVYRLSPVTDGKKKGTWTEKIIHSFNGKNGNGPPAGIVFDATGNIYGTTIQGGKYDNGTVYELVAPVGKGGYQEKLLRSFSLWEFTGATPEGGVILDSTGNLYGTTEGGGLYPGGVVFEVTP